MASKFGSLAVAPETAIKMCALEQNPGDKPHEAAPFAYPNCAFCGATLGCPRCQGADYRVKCKNCHRRTNLMPFFRRIAQPKRAGAHDAIGLVRFTPSGIPMIVEGDKMLRVCRLDEVPSARQLRVSPEGAYLDDAGMPLFPEDWSSTFIEEISRTRQEDVARFQRL